MGYRLRIESPEQVLAAHLRYTSCSAEVEWRKYWRPATQTFDCPACGAPRRLARSASEAEKARVFARDRWTCHRCQLRVDPALPGTHPFGVVADHYPVPRLLSGPTIDQNRRLAHGRCNIVIDDLDALLTRYGQTPAFRAVIERVRLLPRDQTRHVYTPEPMPADLDPARQEPGPAEPKAGYPAIAFIVGT